MSNTLIALSGVQNVAIFARFAGQVGLALETVIVAFGAEISCRKENVVRIFRIVVGTGNADELVTFDFAESASIVLSIAVDALTIEQLIPWDAVFAFATFIDHQIAIQSFALDTSQTSSCGLHKPVVLNALGDDWRKLVN